MIRFHYFELHKDMKVGPHLMKAGETICHVYSDSSIAELLEWGRRHEFQKEWLQDKNPPHFDAFRGHLKHCLAAATNQDIADAARFWRERRKSLAGFELCDRCDGTGTHEEGPALETECQDCAGRGVLHKSGRRITQAEHEMLRDMHLLIPSLFDTDP